MDKRKKGNPQIEDGYTKIANELLEQLSVQAGVKIISGIEMALIIYIIRYTYGFHKTSMKFKNKDMSKYFNLSKIRISQVIKSLIDKRIIFKIDGQIKINKHYNEWVGNVKLQLNNDKEKKLSYSLTKVKVQLNKKLSHSLTKVKVQLNNDTEGRQVNTGISTTPKESIKDIIKYSIKDKRNKIIFKDNVFLNIKEEDKEKWKEIFSDVDRELKKMELWLTAHPHKRYRSYERFIFGWLNRKESGYGQKNNQRYFGITEKISDEEKKRLEGITNAKAGEW